MVRNNWKRVAVAIVIGAAALLTACADSVLVEPVIPTWPGQIPPPPVEDELTVAITNGIAASVLEPSACANLEVPAERKSATRVFATGDQIYRWNGAAWDFVAPSALLHSASAERGLFGTHYAGPTWESRSGSKVRATVVERCTPDPTAIPWLLLRVVEASGSGPLSGVDYVQRVNTVGGLAPAAPGTVPGQEVRVPYTTDYLFFRTDD